MDWSAVSVSLQLSLFTMLILSLVGTPIAYWLAFSRVRARFLVESVVALPLVLPPTVLGLYLLLVMSPRNPVGNLYQRWTGHSLAFSFAGLLVASVLYSLPFAVQPFTAGFRSVDRRLIEAAATLGASEWRTFLRVILPLSRPAVLAGMVLSFAHTLGEFGVVLMVGGNLPGRTRTISIAIYDSVQALNYDAAVTTSLLLLAVSFAALVVTYSLQRTMPRGY